VRLIPAIPRQSRLLSRHKIKPRQPEG